MTAPRSPYRNEVEALAERKATLERELQQLRAQTAQLSTLKEQELLVMEELRALGHTPTSLPAAPSVEVPAESDARSLLSRVRVASPCEASWDEMQGNGRVRFCQHCQKNVYNLTAMTREAAEELLRERLAGGVCVRYYERADGTILTEDCPVGVKKKRRRLALVAAAGAAAMAAGAAAAAVETVEQPPPGRYVAGAPSILSE